MNPFVEGFLKLLGQKAAELAASKLSGWSGSRPASKATNTLDALFMRGLEKYNSEPEEAVQYFHAAATQGHPASQCFLGLCLAGGHGCDEDVDEGIKWLQVAAENGDDFAIEMLQSFRRSAESRRFEEEEDDLWQETNELLSMSPQQHAREILGDLFADRPNSGDGGDYDGDTSGDPDTRKERIREIVADELSVPIEKVTDLADFVDGLGANGRHGSDMRDIYIELRREFGIDIPFTNERKMQKKQIWDLRDLCQYVEKKIAKKRTDDF